MHQADQKIDAHAVVIGGSLAGLLSARVLADHVAQVTLIERDERPLSAEPRKGVPQGRHVHALLRRGAMIVDRLFPDLIAALQATGIDETNSGDEFRWHHYGVWKAKYRSELPILLVNRPAFEQLVAQRVAALPNVRIVAQCGVKRLMTDEAKTRTTGVELAPDDASSGASTLPADLVVDASGRGSQTPRWLQSLGYEAPPEVSIDVNVGYVSRMYERPAHAPEWKALFVVPRAPLTRAAAVFPIDNHRWQVTLAGWLADYPPLDESGYLEFAQSLATPEVYNALKDAQPLTPLVPHKFPANQRRYYEKLKRFPESLVVLGDALCSFNPLHGQGMSVSAMDASTLDACIRAQRRARGDDLRGLSDRFRKKVAKVVDIPWQLATGEDFRYAEVTGARPLGTGLVNWYTGKVHEAAARDAFITERFYRVVHLMAPPTSLLHPAVMGRLLMGARSRRGAAVKDARMPGEVRA